MPEYYPISRIIGKKITYYRKMNGMSLCDISKMIHVSEQQQSRYERGVNRINLDRLHQYARIFSIDLIDFFVLNEHDADNIKRNIEKQSNKDNTK
ncbi:helix-turn-helix domain-containing protein [Providencia alcalifaciens]|nr:helix-turn-helix transcriptional regulator [Providencia alcalifaciens]ATG15420.1 XRE family transcriptional regulator [Providencia alcalifaciens]MTC52329.1 helix-turn-helix domain-containing protein [Providencia alcalifaciens]SQI30916.1 Helix-turn-helix domain [Providencia alcalifaciens]